MITGAPNIVAIIPCHNEQSTIADIVKRVKVFVFQVVVVDNNSTDKTAWEAQRAGAIIAYCHQYGAGVTTQTGVDFALLNLHPDILITLDGDGQHVPEEIPQLIKPVLDKQADFVVGVRPFSKTNSPWVRREAVAFTTWLYNSGWNYKLTEAQCGYRAFNRRVAEAIQISDKRFGFSVETLIRARALGFKILGVPVSCIYHNEGFSLQHVPVLWSLIKWRYKCDRGIMFKKLGYKAFNGVTRPFLGMGFGRIPGANNIYRFMMRNTIENTDSLVEINGYKMAVTIDRDTPIDGISRRLVCDHEYEPFTTEIIKEVVRTDMYAVDIGANVGYYTLLLSNRVGENGVVWAFEPEKRNLAALDDNCRLNGVSNVRLEPFAVHKYHGTLDFYVSKQESGEHSLIDCRKNMAVTRVEAVDLDTYFSNMPLDFIKIDTEGNDANVISGGDRLIRKYRPTIITEFWIDGLLKSGWTLANYWGYLLSLGYDISLVDDFRKKKYSIDLDGVVKYCKKHNGYSANLLLRRNY